LEGDFLEMQDDRRALNKRAELEGDELEVHPASLAGETSRATGFRRQLDGV